MDEVVINVKNLGKRYDLWPSRPGLGSTINRIIKGQKPLKPKEFWALKNVNFKIERGEAVGIIGPNGAGKSTLLKILSRITPPTTGLIETRGKIT